MNLVSFVQESSEFHKRSFECAVDSIRAIAASHLWQVLKKRTVYPYLIIYLFTLNFSMQLVVVRADLNGHLIALKDYFLLAKGDFFQVKGEQKLTAVGYEVIHTKIGGFGSPRLSIPHCGMEYINFKSGLNVLILCMI